MSSSTRTTEFVERLRQFMAPKGPERPLDDFIAALTFDEARDCTTAFFNRETDYLNARAKFLTVFVRLALQSLEKGNPYFALRAEILIHARGRPWERHYTPLSSKQKSTLTRQIKRKKDALTYNQRQFLEWFGLYMNKRASENQMAKFINPSRFEPRRDCLLVYIEASEAYDARNGTASLLVFERLSRVTINAGDALFAHTYNGRVTTAGTPWFDRFQALVPGAQAAIKQDIARKQVIRSDVTVGTKTYTNAPIGTYKFDPVAPEPTHPEDRGKTAPLTVAQEKYLRRYRQYVADGKRESMDALHAFFREYPRDIASCVIAYLKDTRSTDKRSLEVFFGTVWEAINKEDAYYAFKVDRLIHTPGTDWQLRFAALDKKLYADHLEAYIADKRKRARLLDDVKSAYYLKNQRDPTEAALAAFEPAANQAQEELLSLSLSNCEVAVNVENVDMFDKAFTAVSEVLVAQKDPLTLLVLLKRCRERRNLDPRFRHLLYLYGVGLLFGTLLRARPTVYQKGFSREEGEWLVAGSKAGNRYFDDFVVQLEYATQARAGPAALAAMCKGQGLLHIHADRFRLFLTPMIDAAALAGSVKELWDTKPAAVAAIRIPIQSRRDGTKELTIGQRIGKFYILWWDGIKTTAYVQVEGLDETIFEIGPDRLADIYDDDAIYGQIARNTQHLAVLIPLFFEILSYLPGLVSGGVSGLVKDIVFDYLFDKSIQALGLDPTKVQMITLGVGLLSRGLKPSPPKRAQPVGTVEPDFSAIQQKSLAKNAGLVDGKNRLVDAPGTDSVGHAGVPASGSRTATDVPTSTPARGTADADAAVAGGAPAIKTDTRATRRQIVTVPDRKTSSQPAPTVDTTTAKKTDKPVKKDKPAKKEKPAKKDKAPKKDKPPKKEKPKPKPDLSAVPEPIRDETWTFDGRLAINEGRFEIVDPKASPGGFWSPKSKKAQTLDDHKEYENACNQQVFPKMAESVVSGKTVKTRTPHEKGYGSRSSAKTALLKLQAAIKGAILKRRPEGMMEIVEGTGKNAWTTEAHFFESTLQKEFRPTTGFRGQKQRQISGTLWIANEIKRKGYTPDTKLYYHIASTGHPHKTTVAYLNKLMDEVPNVTITWYIVK